MVTHYKVKLFFWILAFNKGIGNFKTAKDFKDNLAFNTDFW